ncbi:TPA: hypothetical protein ACH3X1_006901 [Trebouxia sp. C0004]
MLLEELVLSPLQVFWWQQTLEFWNKIAASLVGSLFHTILLDNLDDAFSVGNGAKNFSCSIATCSQSVGQPMRLDSGTIPVLKVVDLASGPLLARERERRRDKHCGTVHRLLGTKKAGWQLRLADGAMQEAVTRSEALCP